MIVRRDQASAPSGLVSGASEQVAAWHSSPAHAAVSQQANVTLTSLHEGQWGPGDATGAEGAVNMLQRA